MTRRHRLIVLFASSLSLLILGVDVTVVNVALPAIQHDFHAGLSGLQWTIDAYLLVLASLLMFSGSMGDRIGRRRMFLTGLVIFATASLACSLAPNLGSLIAFRALEGVGASMLNPNSLSVMTSVFSDPKERAQAIGVWAAIFGVSTASGPVLGGLLIAGVGWRAIFIVNLPIALIAFVLMARYAPESRAARPRRPDPVGQLLVIGVLAGLTYAIIEGPVEGWGSATIISLFTGAAAALAAFLAWERRRNDPLLELRFFRSPPFTGAAMIATCVFFVFSAFLFLNTLYLQEVRGFSPLLAGVATLPATVVIVGAAPLSGRYVARRGSRVPLAAAGLVTVAGGILLAQENVGTPYLALVCGYLLIGLSMGLANPPITNTAVAGMPASQTGVAASVASTSRQIGNALGVAVIGAITTDALHGRLAAAVAQLHVAPAVRRALLHVSAGGPGLRLPAGTPDPGRLRSVVDASFALATHDGWYLTAASGVVVLVVALTTTGPGARRRAAQVMAASGKPEAPR